MHIRLTLGELMRGRLLMLVVIMSAVLGTATTFVDDSGATASEVVAPASLAAGQPNVVVITVDDMREDELAYMPRTRGAAGRPGRHVRRTRFAPYPLCCPARASFLTGQYAPQPRGLVARAAVGLQRLRDRHDAPGVAAGRRLLHGVPRQVPQRLRHPARADGRHPDSTPYCPPGWTDWRGAVDGGLGRRPPAGRRHLPVLRHHAQRQRRVLPRARPLPDRRSSAT